MDGEILIYPRLEELTYLGSGRFAGKTTEGWQLYNRNGRPLLTEAYDAISTIDNSYMIVLDKGSFALIDTSGSLVIPFTSCRLEPLENGYFSGKTRDLSLVFHPGNAEYSDTLTVTEHWMSNGWINGKTAKNQPYLRRFGHAERLVLPTLAKPEIVGDLVLIETNGNYTVYNQQLQRVLPKSVKTFGVLKGKDWSSG